ncbi:acyltransferase family protein [Mucilaginibacter phenanthrenivorans]|uniref:acyltransferase family protein n=1 Tax=Mucilaginibacter phenanthrenivorans TaxID=1234842 RepID=UPI00358F7C31
MQESTPAILKTKQHFEILDGLRGVAALGVVTFHFMEVAYSDYSKNFIGHGFLAVDFFFCLSGFVIGYAYDDRIGKMGVMEFFKSRIIRLHPLVVLGSIIGVLLFLFDPFVGHPELYSAGKIVLLFLASIFLVPYPAMPSRYFNLFGLNAPAWSLFWEYIANIVYAFVLCKLSRKYLLLLTIIAAIGICLVAYRAGNMMGGWDGLTFWHGGVRVSFSFLAGLLVYRSNWIIKNRLGFIGVALLLMLALLSPFSKWNWLSEPFIIVLYFPLLIALGAGAILTPAFKKTCVLSGKISYPLYMTHYAFIWVFAAYNTKYKPVAGQLALIIICSLVLLVAFAWLMMVLYDIPVRKYLSEKRKQRLKA